MDSRVGQLVEPASSQPPGSFYAVQQVAASNPCMYRRVSTASCRLCQNYQNSERLLVGCIPDIPVVYCLYSGTQHLESSQKPCESARHVELPCVCPNGARSCSVLHLRRVPHTIICSHLNVTNTIRITRPCRRRAQWPGGLRQAAVGY